MGFAGSHDYQIAVAQDIRATGELGLLHALTMPFSPSRIRLRLTHSRSLARCGSPLRVDNKSTNANTIGTSNTIAPRVCRRRFSDFTAENPALAQCAAQPTLVAEAKTSCQHAVAGLSMVVIHLLCRKRLLSIQRLRASALDRIQVKEAFDAAGKRLSPVVAGAPKCFIMPVRPPSAALTNTPRRPTH